MKWTLKEIVGATNGTLYHAHDEEAVVSGFHFDTRKLKTNDLFVPIVASRDGHDFVKNAIEKGASAIFWSKEIGNAPVDIPVIHVSDTLKAFQDMAKWYLTEIDPLVVGITGSNGKTTTKDMTEAVLSTKYQTHKTQGNFNNQIGLPVTILEMPETTEAIILEMGMDKPGEIRILSQLAEPDVAVITMVGESHIEFFGSREAIAEGKKEILDGLKSQGTFVYPREEPLLRNVANENSRQYTFGKAEEADLYPLDITTHIRKTVFSVNQAPQMEVVLPTPGEYNVQNALASLLVGVDLGIPLKEGAMGLASFKLTKNRLEWLDGTNGSYLLNDAYNASPSSVKAVLNYFSEIEIKGKKIVVLGDILELGELSNELHQSIAVAVDPESIDELILYGEEMKVLYEGVKNRFNPSVIHHYSGDKTDMVEYLKKQIQPNDAIVLKSSLGTDLLHVVNELTQK